MRDPCKVVICRDPSWSFPIFRFPFFLLHFGFPFFRFPFFRFPFFRFPIFRFPSILDPRPNQLPVLVCVEKQGSIRLLVGVAYEVGDNVKIYILPKIHAWLLYFDTIFMRPLCLQPAAVQICPYVLNGALLLEHNVAYNLERCSESVGSIHMDHCLRNAPMEFHGYKFYYCVYWNRFEYWY